MHTQQNNFKLLTSDIANLRNFLIAKKEEVQNQDMNKQDFIEFIDNLFAECPLMNVDITKLLVIQYEE